MSKAAARRTARRGLPFAPPVANPELEALRAAVHYEIITPDECVARHKANAEFFATIHPLIGGMPLERGWQCLKLYAEQVLPALN